MLLESDRPQIAFDWSEDGKYIIFNQYDTKTGLDIWVLPVDEKEPFPYLQAPFDQYDPQLSPDGKWMAYAADESGISQVYVQPFPTATGARWQISTSGGGTPKWRRDGKELYFLGEDRRLRVVEIKTDPAFEASIPMALFPVQGKRVYDRYEYDVSADGQKFMISTLVEESPAVTLLFNWLR